MRKQKGGITLTTISDFFRSFPLATIFQLASVLVLVANLFLANKLGPLVQDIDTLREQVHAMNESLQDRPALIQRFVVTEQQVKDLRETLKDMQNRETRIEDKIDHLLER